VVAVPIASQTKINGGKKRRATLLSIAKILACIRKLYGSFTRLKNQKKRLFKVLEWGTLMPTDKSCEYNVSLNAIIMALWYFILSEDTSIKRKTDAINSSRNIFLSLSAGGSGQLVFYVLKAQARSVGVLEVDFARP
jgi:hypothetical protein